jgi:hypothetical protein
MRRFAGDVLVGSAEEVAAVEAARCTSILPLASASAGHAFMPPWTALAQKTDCGVRQTGPGAFLRTALIHRTTGLLPVSRAFPAIAAGA